MKPNNVEFDLDALEQDLADTDLTIGSLSRAEIKTAEDFTREEIMATVGLYYSIQNLRKGASNKESAHQRNTDTLSDPLLIQSLKNDLHKIELQAAKAMTAYAKAQPLGRWALSCMGVGPITTAAFLAHIDLMACACIQYRGIPRHQRPKHDCPGIQAAGAVWRFAGLDPTVKWEKGRKRPYNAKLKACCWNLGQCIKKATGSKNFKQNPMQERALYLRLYQQRKKQEETYNAQGRFAQIALELLSKSIERFDKKAVYTSVGKDKDGNRILSRGEIWEKGKLQPIALDQRATRYAVKIFLSHYHEVGRKLLGFGPIKPWVIEHGGHKDYIPPPNLHVAFDPPKKGRGKRVAKTAC